MNSLPRCWLPHDQRLWPGDYSVNGVMDRIYVFLIRNDVWIYILCGLGLVWYLGQLVRSRYTLRRAMFGLEKERGRRMFSRSLLFVILFLAVIAAVTYINLSIAPTLPADLLKPATPTPNIFITPLSSPTPPEGQPTPTFEIAPTVTLPASGSGGTSGVSPDVLALTPSATVSATSTPANTAVACDPSVIITSPPNGATISGGVTFFGTAASDEFAYFVLEFTGPETGDQWRSLDVPEAGSPVFDNIIGSIETLGWSPGTYLFRLSVFDNADGLTGQCQVQLSIIPADS